MSNKYKNPLGLVNYNGEAIGLQSADEPEKIYNLDYWDLEVTLTEKFKPGFWQYFGVADHVSNEFFGDDREDFSYSEDRNNWRRAGVSW